MGFHHQTISNCCYRHCRKFAPSVCLLQTASIPVAGSIRAIEMVRQQSFDGLMDTIFDGAVGIQILVHL